MKYYFYRALLFALAGLTGCASKKSTLPSSDLHIDDFSRLNKTPIKAFYTPSTYEEVGSILEHARQKNIKVSVAGAQHSQGGQSFCPHGIVIQLKNLNNVLNINTEAKTITVQTGATWKEVQKALNPYNLAVKIMQFLNVVTVGGALSVNANGIDPHCGPFIESVRSFKIMRADGTIVTASRTEHTELFRLAIGGYGLYGIILETTLGVVENKIYQRSSTLMSLEEYVQSVKTLRDEQTLGFHFTQVTLTPHKKKLFGPIESVYYHEINPEKLSPKKLKKIRTLYKERFVSLKKVLLSVMRTSAVIKANQRAMDVCHDGIIISRNNIMNPPVSQVYSDSDTVTELLQEYFIPVDNIATFINALEDATQTHGINLMHVSLRFIPRNTECFLSYTKHDSLGVVILFSQHLTEDTCHATAVWTRALIDAAAHCSGTYYLPIQLHATQQQLRQIYPEIDRFFAYKKQYDPQELFSNHFYEKYAQRAL